MNDHAEKPLLLVFGFGPGLGEALASTFGAAGYRVAGASRSAETDQSLEAFQHYSCDVTDAGSVEHCVSQIVGDLGPPSVVVYNPMMLRIRPFLEIEPDEFESVWRVSCLGAMLAAKAVLPSMLDAGGGSLILTGATASIRGSANFASLATAKFGLRGLSQSLAREFGPKGIHVVHSIIDGLIWAPQTIERFSPKQESCLSAAAIARAYLEVSRQEASCWTQELDLRPSVGAF